MRKRVRRELVDAVPDEQEQEEIILDFRAQNKETMATFSKIIVLICLLATMVMTYLVTRQTILVHILSITSLLLTIYILHYLSDEDVSQLASPLASYAPVLNALLIVLTLILTTVRSTSGHALQELTTSMSSIPLLMYILAMLLRRSTTATERAIRSLEQQKFNLRGA